MNNTAEQTTVYETPTLDIEQDATCDKMSHLEAEKEYLRLKELLASMKRGKHSRQRGTKGAFGSRGLNRKEKITNLLRPNKQ
jgi:hypothetical protein